MLYGHGDDIYGYKVTDNFSSNVYNGTDLSALYQWLSERMPCIASYPEAEPLSAEAAIASDLGIAADEVCVTNGAIEAIYLVAQAFRASRSLIGQPTFSEYADACHIHGHDVRFSTNPIEAPSDADIVWICNPNNPTGKAIPKKQIAAIVEKCHPTLFVMDQSYEAFTPYPLVSAKEAVGSPNIILLHSMTKRYAIPGLRIGYIVANKELLKQIRQIRMPWSVNALAIEAVRYFLENKPLLQPPLDELLAETQRLREAIKKLDIAEVCETDTHFFLVRLHHGHAVEVKKYLLQKYHILIRDASNFNNLNNRYLRISTQLPDKNSHLIEALRKWKELHSF